MASVRRGNAVVNKSLELRIKFRYDDLGTLFDPYEFDSVTILDSDEYTVLENINIVSVERISLGYYRIYTSASWNTTPRAVYDRWTVRKSVGEDLVDAIEDTLIRAVAITPGGGTANSCIVYGTLYDVQGNPLENTLVTANILMDSPLLDESLEVGFGNEPVQTLTDSSGNFELTLAREIDVRLIIPIIGYDEKVSIPDAAFVSFIGLTES